MHRLCEGFEFHNRSFISCGNRYSGDDLLLAGLFRLAASLLVDQAMIMNSIVHFLVEIIICLHIIRFQLTNIMNTFINLIL
jgi:hypothetical protein